MFSKFWCIRTGNITCTQMIGTTGMVSFSTMKFIGLSSQDFPTVTFNSYESLSPFKKTNIKLNIFILTQQFISQFSGNKFKIISYNKTLKSSLVKTLNTRT